MDYKEIVESLLRENKITEADILAIKGHDPRKLAFTDALHGQFCNNIHEEGSHSCHYYMEENETETWDRLDHKVWSAHAGRLYQLLRSSSWEELTAQLVEATTNYKHLHEHVHIFTAMYSFSFNKIIGLLDQASDGEVEVSASPQGEPQEEGSRPEEEELPF